MTKLDFIFSLHEKLSGLPQTDIEERITFYVEMIEDRMEEGLSEEDAVAAVGTVEEIAGQIIAEVTPAPVSPKKKIKQKRKAWEIVLLVFGSPIWLSLLIAAFAVVLSLYICLWAVVISLWAAFASFAGCCLGGIAGGIGLICSGNGYPGVIMIGAGLVCAGLAIFLFYGCRAVTKGTLRLSKKLFQKCFHKKEVA